MVIYDLNIRYRSIHPTETDAPLVIDADAPPAVAISGELFQAVAGRHAEEIEGCRGVQLLQRALRSALHVLRKLSGKTPVKQLLGFLAGECLDHGGIVSTRGSIVKR